MLLQTGAIFVSTKRGRIITDRGTFITNRDSYYKSMQILQIDAKITSILIGSLLLKLKTITMNFEINIFFNILKDNVHRQGLLLVVLEVATRIRIHRRCLLGDNPIWKTFKRLSLVESLLN